MTETFRDALTTLHARHIDAKAGFDVMVARADPEFRATATRFRDLHARHAQDLLPMLPKGARTNGSFMSTVNKAVVTLRDMFDTIDQDVMTQVRDGEVWIERAYDDAIEAAPTDLRKDLLVRKSELTQLLRDTAHSA